ncbi:alpha/beta hydrolase [Rheinheimera sp. 4Y26]|uniref:alpha/beta hydrolase n=1 Tax=Rheinheimera sp. 4Y26 TaxID=2977811 RepID=UPI0021B11840|nr:alpha/beta hydrolase-fold protein [Rheinheimera sp. 4Y26]MCT6698205.1 alpha/beta hydrolase-fold protein [Rheinheimera sp. 4Y26]
MRILITWVFLFFTAVPVLAADPGELVVIAKSYKLHSKILKDTRRYNVMLPAGYEEGKADYPLLILLDGGANEDFHHLSDIVQVSVGNGSMRPFIVVGIEKTQRRRDFTPATDDPRDKEVAPIVGGANEFRRFLAEELLPNAKRHPNLPARSLAAYHPLHFHVTTSFSNHPVN